MKSLAVVLSILVAVAMVLVNYPNGAVSFFLVVILSIPCIFILHKLTPNQDKRFIVDLFLIALSLRLLLGIALEVLDLRMLAGGDAKGYDMLGSRIAEYWHGLVVYNDPLTRLAMERNSNWGMNFLVAILYYVIGPNIFAAQSACAVFGAATPPLAYLCSLKIFKNRDVAKYTAIALAVVPAFILWSGQLLKDGLIAFLLVLAIYLVMRLQERFNWLDVVLLMGTMAGVMALRFYIFYMIAAAVAGSFVVGSGTTNNSMFRRTAALIVIAFGLTYFGVMRTASLNLSEYGQLERIQMTRDALSRDAGSGFGDDIDVSTTGGAVMAMPVGLTYLMFSPFPWEFKSIHQFITLPDLLIWWATIPFIVMGLVYTFRYRLRDALPILLFVLMLSLAYSLFQGNTGMIYRQRIQIQVFLFMIAAVGWTLVKERRENRRIIQNEQAQLVHGSHLHT
ncbi:MAG: glycosyltransferase family 39 protein [Acidobacteria bacterium]|nr:glycosyltransferase family 39 protein [Acidobacteriota bacterium]